MPDRDFEGLTVDQKKIAIDYELGYDWIPGRFGPPPGIPKFRKQELGKCYRNELHNIYFESIFFSVYRQVILTLSMTWRIFCIIWLHSHNYSTQLTSIESQCWMSDASIWSMEPTVFYTPVGLWFIMQLLPSTHISSTSIFMGWLVLHWWWS